jgi:hypothetical protein
MGDGLQPPTKMEKLMFKIAHSKFLVGALALATGLSAVTVAAVAPASAQTIGTEAQSADSLAVVMDFLSNTAPDKVEAAAKRLVAEDATYVSLNSENPELKKIEPWTGTGKGPSAYSSTFLRVANYWKIEDFSAR